MFWNELAAAAEESSLQKLLASSDNPPLRQVLAEPLMFQELRQGNKNIVSYLTRSDRLVELVKNALEPEDESGGPIESQYKVSHISAEVLTVRNIDEVVNAFVECPEALAVLMNALNKGKLNAVTSIFYNKIITHMLARHFFKAFELMKRSGFLKKALSCIGLGSISNLLQNLTRIPSNTDEVNAMRQYLVDLKLVPSLIELLDPAQPCAVHDNAAETYSDILRNLREVLSSYDEREDILHDEFLKRDSVEELARRMLLRDENGAPNASLLLNGSEMFLDLLETNNCYNRPSILLNDDRLFGEGASEEPCLETNRGIEMWVPDHEHIAETVVAGHAADIVKIILDDLSAESPSDSWFCLLNLLAALCDTNHLPTHILLTAGFKEAGFEKLFDLVWTLPQCTVFHRLLSKIVAHVLFSNTGTTPSPLIDFFIKDCDVVTRLSLGIQPTCVYTRMSLLGIRVFHVHLAHCFHVARKKATNNDHIDDTLKGCPEWPAVNTALFEFLDLNRPDLQSDASTSRSVNVEDFSQNNGTAELEDFESYCQFESTKISPMRHDNMPGFPTSAFDNFSIERGAPFESFDIDLKENAADESNFESLCEMKSFDDWTLSKHDIDSAEGSVSSTDKVFPASTWPGEEAEASEKSGKEEDDIWDKNPLSNGSSSGDDWPAESPKTEPDAKTDEWADFTSQRKSLDSAEWPGLDTSSECDTSPKNASEAEPVCTGWTADFPSSAVVEVIPPGETDA